MTKTITLILTLCLLTSHSLIGQKNPGNLEINWKTDKTNYTLPLEELTALMLPDGIPPIDDPQFFDKEEALQNYFEHEPAIVVEFGGNAKAYPLSVLTFHEIVNDHVGEVFFVVTYCPLCNSSVVFSRKTEINNEKYVLDFGVSGMLHSSNLILYDRQTQSWWQQFTGEAIVGKFAGRKLDFIDSYIISLSEFFESYPKGQVLSNNTGYDREYGTNPYIGYDSKEAPPERFFSGKPDDRLPAMERIVNIEINGKHKVYPHSILTDEIVINDVFEGKSIVLFYTSKTVSILDEKDISKSKSVGSVAAFLSVADEKNYTFFEKNGYFYDTETGSKWNITGHCVDGELKGSKLQNLHYGNHFAFAWFAFYPDSELYQLKKQ